MGEGRSCLCVYSCFYGIVRHTHTHTHTSESIVIQPPDVLRNVVEAARSSFANYTAHLKNAPHELGWHCLSRTFDA